MPSTQSLGGRVRSLGGGSKPAIDIEVNGPPHRTFTTLDRIDGTVTISPSQPTPFDQVEISLVGSTRTFVDRLGPTAAVSARSEAFQLFLKMDMPINDDSYPEDRLLLPSQTYRFPFTFIVPEALPNSCKHRTSSHKLKDMHLRLPPTLGDAGVFGKSGPQLHDCAPEMVKISYGIRVRLQRRRPGQDKDMIISDRTHKVRIIPAMEEQPPIEIGDEDEYCLRREKSLRKGLLKAKNGRVVVEALQPQSLHLPAPTDDDSGEDPSAMATIQLRFEPMSDNVEPPKLGQLVSKLRVGTFFASTPRLSFPSTRAQMHDTNQGLYVDVLPLSSRNMSATEWLKHEPYTVPAEANVRRDSGMSLSGQASCPEPTKEYKAELPFYTAQLLVPITPPKGKTLVPTFHSCLVSRLYNLELSLSIGPSTSVSLKVPIQISSAGTTTPGADELDDLANDPIAAELTGVDHDFFRPPGLSAPEYPGPGGMVHNAGVQAPPVYSYFAPRAGGVMPASEPQSAMRAPMVR